MFSSAIIRPGTMFYCYNFENTFGDLNLNSLLDQFILEYFFLLEQIRLLVIIQEDSMFAFSLPLVRFLLMEDVENCASISGASVTLDRYNESFITL